VAVLIAPAIVTFSFGPDASPTVRYGIAGVALLMIVVAVAVSRSRSVAMGDDEPPPVVRDEPAATGPGEAVEAAAGTEDGGPAADRTTDDEVSAADRRP
jgi:K(+)-stimulated pyrophosphate-energized sodium pump